MPLSFDPNEIRWATATNTVIDWFSFNDVYRPKTKPAKMLPTVAQIESWIKSNIQPNPSPRWFTAWDEQGMVFTLECCQFNLKFPKTKCKEVFEALHSIKGLIDVKSIGVALDNITEVSYITW